ncbi:uncharacterized protein LOC141690015 [Apium graveolens]|uniref:uncharacterized protein LOC141690015 n=1 Tax=Apium graveolens TaxID=4045 RepID=UPI003D7B58D3
MVSSWLLNSITPEIRNSVAYFSTAKAIWDDLVVRFSHSNVPRVFQLKKELVSLTQGTLSITAYFTKFRTLMDEIDDLSPLPKCICVNSNCCCAYVIKLDEYEQINKLSQFLMGLSDQFTTIRGQLLMMKPLPSLSQAYSLLLQEEVQRDCHNSVVVTENAAMSIKYTGNKHRNFSQNNYNSNQSFQGGVKKVSSEADVASIVCDFCHMTGHTREKCFCLHGYPEWHRLRGQPKLKPRVVNRYPAVSKKVVNVMASGFDSNTNVESGSVFTDAQCQQLTKMIQTSLQALTPWTTNNANVAAVVSSTMTDANAFTQGNFSCTVSSAHTLQTVNHQNFITWLLDSGATDHVTCHYHLLENHVPMNSYLYLPDGNMAVITHSGTVRLPNSIILQQVLCVPSFHCNLISIPKLTVHNSCTVVFSFQNCMLQDQQQKMLTKIGKLEGSLYTYSLAGSASVFHVSTSDSQLTLWHARLGHPSSTIMSKIQFIPSVNPDALQYCDVCHQAKQTRLSFTASTSVNITLFSLVHCDLWGPYKTCTHGKCTIFLTIIEDVSKCTWVFLLADKSSISTMLKNYIAYVQTQFHTTIQVIRSDNGTEFVNSDLSSHLQSLGIIHQTTCPYTP